MKVRLFGAIGFLLAMCALSFKQQEHGNRFIGTYIGTRACIKDGIEDDTFFIKAGDSDKNIHITHNHLQTTFSAIITHDSILIPRQSIMVYTGDSTENSMLHGGGSLQGKDLVLHLNEESKRELITFTGIKQ